jgi:hypothetical protein
MRVSVPQKQCNQFRNVDGHGTKITSSQITFQFIFPSFLCLCGSWRTQAASVTEVSKTCFWTCDMTPWTRGRTVQGLYLHRTTQQQKMRTNIHSSAEFEPTIPVSKRLRHNALNRVATVTDSFKFLPSVTP